MPKTKESIAAYNKEYFSRPEVIARAKVRNAQYRQRRADYKKTEAGISAQIRYNHSPAGRRTNKSKQLKNLYGISLEEYEAMAERQQGLCAICGVEPLILHVDHCHDSNKVRGLLCGSCNRAIGLLKDNVTSLHRAIEYLNGFYSN